MTLTHADLERLCALAVDAALAAGRYIARTRPEKIEHKAGAASPAAQVVTEVDRASQARILDVLAPSFDRFDLALLTEESPDDGSRLVKDYFWCIDPIDGTLCFIDGVAGYAVSIALVAKDGVPHIGVVYDPAGDVLYRAVRGRGAFRNHEPWRIESRSATAPLEIFTDKSELSHPQFVATARALEATVGAAGGAVMNAIRCLENPPALFFKTPKPGQQRGGCLWDFAATGCLYHELGAWVSDARGSALDLNRADSVYLAHCGVLFAAPNSAARRYLKIMQAW